MENLLAKSTKENKNYEKQIILLVRFMKFQIIQNVVPDQKQPMSCSITIHIIQHSAILV